MHFLVFSVLFSVLEFSTIKFFKKLNINIVYSIVYSYPISLLCSLIIFKSEPTINKLIIESLPILGILGILLPLVFMLIVVSVNKSGIIISILAQRLSLVIPVLYSFAVFKEKFDYISLLGIFLAFTSTFLVIPFKKTNNNVSKISWIYPLGIFIGVGIIDIIYGYIAKIPELGFEKSLISTFLIASITGPLTVKLFYKESDFKLKTVLSGCLLGIINFGAIFFFTQALKYFYNTIAIVFIIQAVGVISLGLIIGVIFFKEKLTIPNIIGVILAITSIIILGLYK